MKKSFFLILMLALTFGTLVGCDKLTKEADQEFGDQNFKTSIALIELHKVRTGEYPESLKDLEFLGDWDEIYIAGVEYKKLDMGYELNLVKGWVGVPDQLTYPDAFWEGLGLVKSNLKPDTVTAESYEGTYFYEYDQNTSNGSENQYIILEVVDDTLVGRYYGGTDYFDDVREGYAQGFFVAEMKNLAIDQNTITFSIQLFPKDVFSAQIDLSYKTSEEVDKTINEPWLNAHIFNSEEGITKVYRGTIEYQRIKFDDDIELKEFKKID